MRTIIATALVELVILVAGFSVLDARRTYLQSEVINLASGDPGWRVTVTWVPDDTNLLLTLRMDGLSHHQDVKYRVVSSQPWLNLWEGRFVGHLSETLTLQNDGTPTPWPMNAEKAGLVAQSVNVFLDLDGTSKTVSFADPGFVTPVTGLEALLDNVWGQHGVRVVRP